MKTLSPLSVAVKKGEHLTTTYTDTLKTTLERRRHLRQTKIFDCDCERCRDATELSTHGSSWRCEKCNGGLVVSMDPLNSASNWHCESCKSQYRYEVK
jgi:ribosomal protein L37AE/L43A